MQMFANGSGEGNGSAIVISGDEQVAIDVKENMLVIFPNPFNGPVFIEDAGRDRIKMIVVTSIDGRDFGQVKYVKDMPLDLSFLSTGMYLISVKLNDESTIVRRMLKY